VSWWIINDRFNANFLQRVTTKEFLKSINTWWRYGLECGTCLLSWFTVYLATTFASNGVRYDYRYGSGLLRQQKLRGIDHACSVRLQITIAYLYTETEATCLIQRQAPWKPHRCSRHTHINRWPFGDVDRLSICRSWLFPFILYLYRLVIRNIVHHTTAAK